MRPRVSVYVAMSLDGFIAGPAGDLDWLESAAGAGEDYGFDAFLAGIDAIAMGRGTWDVIQGIEELPYRDRPVFVFTHRPAPPRAGVTFWAEDPAGAMAAWVDRGLAAVYVDGGLLVHQFLEAELVEDLTVTVVPTLLGDGIPLFHRRGSGAALQLDGFRSWPSGMVQLRYRVPGSV